MVNQIIVDILVKRIQQGWINPKTNLPLAVGDILISDYQTAVQDVLATQ